ncbi:MmpS family transport accessory protein, partial [Micromonospora sp. KC721]|uniref:MmpS family transport accessory protein n=1 Tax=Micromonospora sp. KC721 TaxID=2530380 RepID=UPI001FB85071
PGRPPVGRSTSGGGRVAGIVIAVVAVLALGICACLGAASVLVGRFGSEPVAEDPYHDGYDEQDSWTPAAPSQPTPATTPSGGPGRYPVSYEVTGTGRGNIQYYDANGDFIRLESVRLPWREKIRTDDPNRVIVIATGDGDGALSCTARIGDRAPVTQVGEPGREVTCQPS